jgi:hypothetical protein
MDHVRQEVIARAMTSLIRTHRLSLQLPAMPSRELLAGFSYPVSMNGRAKRDQGQGIVIACSEGVSSEQILVILLPEVPIARHPKVLV